MGSGDDGLTLSNVKEVGSGYIKLTSKILK